MAEEKIKIEEGEAAPAEEKEIQKTKKKRRKKENPSFVDEFTQKNPERVIEKSETPIKEIPAAETAKEAISELSTQGNYAAENNDFSGKKEKIESEEISGINFEDGGGKKKIWKIALIILSITVILSLLGAVGYFYYKYKAVSKGKGAAEQGAEYYVSKIGKFIILPEDEEPTLATVTDVEKLKGQTFFEKAQNGDKVLLFVQAQKAILYRPSDNKVVEVMPVAASGIEQNNGAAENASQAEETNAAGEESPQSARVAVYNGTKTRGLAKAIGEKAAAISGIAVTEAINAAGTFTKTIVVDLSGKHGAFTKQIIQYIGGEAGALPEGETKPDADVLIIGGSDFKSN